MADTIKENKSKVVIQSRSLSTMRSLTANLNQKSLSRLKVRRQSFGFSGVPGIRPVERTSQLAMEFKRPPLLYSNTYQLDPTERWNITLVTKASEEILDELFNGHKYNTQESPNLALRIAGELMRKIKALGFDRYRCITVVTLGQKRAQSYNNAIAFLWDHERDNYVDMMREENTCFIQVTVFACKTTTVRQRGKTSKTLLHQAENAVSSRRENLLKLWQENLKFDRCSYINFFTKLKSGYYPDIGYKPRLVFTLELVIKILHLDSRGYQICFVVS